MKKFDLNQDVVYTFGTYVFDNNASLFRENSFFDITLTKDPNGWAVGDISGSRYVSAFEENDIEEFYVVPKYFDLTFGVSDSSSYCNAASQELGNANFFPQKRQNYKKFAGLVFGNYDQKFVINGEEQDELIFVSLPRNQVRDFIVPKTLKVRTNFSASAVGGLFSGKETLAVKDLHSYVEVHDALDLEASSRVGRVGSLFFPFAEPNGSFKTNLEADFSKRAGLIYYDIGLMVLIPDQIGKSSSVDYWYQSGTLSASYGELVANASSSNTTLDTLYRAASARLSFIKFQSTSKVAQTFYTCKADRGEFCYSSNPSYIDNSGKIRTLSGAQNFSPSAYISKIGLLGENQELLAVGNLSKPLKKTFENEIEILVRLDY